jgi:CoA:oxalate CoA-transferase
MEAVLASNTTAHWISVLDEYGVPCGPINDVGQSADHPQTLARNMIVDVDDPVTGPMRVVGNPVKISGFADPTTRAPSPNLDENREAILRQLGG